MGSTCPPQVYSSNSTKYREPPLHAASAIAVTRLGMRTRTEMVDVIVHEEKLIENDSVEDQLVESDI